VVWIGLSQKCIFTVIFIYLEVCHSTPSSLPSYSTEHHLQQLLPLAASQTHDIQEHARGDTDTQVLNIPDYLETVRRCCGMG
jgi:hypothetical protein